MSSDAQPTKISKIEELPDEVIEAIVLAGPGLGPHVKHLAFTLMLHKRKYWLKCSLVSRRWYRITSAHLFRFVHVDAASPGTVQDFCDMLSRNPTLANIVEALIIDTVTLSINTLASLLDLLPRLRWLDMLSIILTRTRREIPNRERLCGTHKLAKLYYQGSPRGAAGSFQWEVIEILQLFEEIGELELDDPQKGTTMNVDAAVVARGKPIIHTIIIPDLLPQVDCSYLTCLHKSGAFRNFVGLYITCHSPVKVSLCCKILSYVGATLLELHLCLAFREINNAITARDKTRERRERNQIISKFRSGLAACVVLHGFRLQMLTSWSHGLDSAPGYASNPRRISQIAVKDMLLCFDLISIVADSDAKVEGGHIRHISLWYHSHEWRSEDIGFEVLPWERMRTVLHQFKELHTIAFLYHWPYSYDTQETAALEEASAECFAREMQDFAPIMWYNELGMFFCCLQEECEWAKDPSRYQHQVYLKKYRRRETME